MRRRSLNHVGIASCAGLLAGLTLMPESGLAQEATPPAASPAVRAAEVAALAEEIAVLRALRPLSASSEQLAALSKAVDDAGARLAAQTQTDTKAMAALRDPLLRARQQLLPVEINLNDPQLAGALQADRQVSAAHQTAQRNQERLRTELTASLRRQLQSLLTTAQWTTLLGQGRLLAMGERAQQDRLREQQRQQMMAQRGAAGQAGGPGTGGGRGGGRGGREGGEPPQRMLEALRGADSEQFSRMSRTIARRFGDEGTPAYQNALSAFERVRSMPDAQFRRQRSDLARQFGAAMTAPRSTADAANSISAENATDTWVRRYLLSPQAPTALKSLAGAKSGAKVEALGKQAPVIETGCGFASYDLSERMAPRPRPMAMNKKTRTTMTPTGNLPAPVAAAPSTSRLSSANRMSTASSAAYDRRWT